MKKQIMTHYKEVTLNVDCSFDQSAVGGGEHKLNILEIFFEKIEWSGNGLYGGGWN